MAATVVKDRNVDRQQTRSHLFLIAGVALAAMTAGHALVVAVSVGSGYRHIVQAPAIELAILLVGAGALAAARRLFKTAGDRHTAPDWVLPAIVKLQALGPVRLIAWVVALQTLSLFAGEAAEQRLAGVSLAGTAALFGSTLSVAPLIYLTVGVAMGLALWLLARAICRHLNAAIEVLRAAIAWLARSLDTIAAPSRRRLALNALLPPRQPLAYRIANRPPPASVRFA